MIFDENFNIDISFYLISFVIYLAVGLYVVYTGHPHEDAYILFKYSENLALGNGIAYNPDGPPASGATDFLWMISIAVLNVIGFNSAVAAYLLNAGGIGLIVFTLLRLSWSVNKLTDRLILGSVITAITITSSFASAGLAGFSAPVFAAASVFMFALYLSPQRHQQKMPFFSLIIGLIRPDGVFLGIGFWALSLLKLKNDKEHLQKFLLYTGACVLVGAIYILFRYAYFGYILPLPLMAKTHVSGTWAYAWLANLSIFPLPSLALSALIVGLIVKGSDNKNVRGMIAAALPFALHLIALSFSQRTQNVDLRFFAPEYGALLVACTFLIRYVYVYTNRNMWMLSVLIAGSLISLKNGGAISNRIEYLKGYEETKLMNHSYINVFPYILQNNMSGDLNIVVTEAGRFPYWLEGNYTDVIGLNSYQFAKELGSIESIREIGPDMIFYHQAGTVNFSHMDIPNNDSNFASVDPSKLYESTEPKNWYDIENPVRRMPIVLTEFLHESQKYEVFAASYGGRYNHIYAIRKGSSIDIQGFKNALSDSYLSENYMSYMEMKRQLSN